jgi:TRAP transporter 4TM/12TM fusion protein
MRRPVVERVVSFFSIAICIYIFYATIWGPYKTTIVHRAIFLAAMLCIFFWSGKPLGSNRFSFACDTTLVVATLFALGYVTFYWQEILAAIGGTYLTPLQLTVGSIIILSCLEAVRRMSLPLFGIAMSAVAYTLLGNYIPGEFSHAGMGFKRFIYLTAFSHEGIFGLGLAVAATYLFMFILFSTVLQHTGASDFFLSLTNSLVGKTRGGPAKSAVLASGMTGTMIGSSIGNVVTTGSITIPMMKRVGFPPDVAAAIEVVASEGAQLIPPIMGAGAFLMAELTGIPYWNIALAAIVPSLLYYLSVFIVVDMESVKMGMKGLKEVERTRDVLRRGGHFLIPIAILFYLLLVTRLTPTYAGLLTVFVAIAVSQIQTSTRLKLPGIIKVFDLGGRACASITALIAVIGIVQQAFTITGLGPRMSELLVYAAGGLPLVILIMAMIITILLGMGLPTPVAYLISGIFVAPAVIEVGFSELAAHLFIFFFAIKSGSTPPIAIVAVVAAAIANSNWWRTAWLSFVYSWPGFIIAFAFMFYPGFLLEGGWLKNSVRLALGVIGTAGMAYGMQRHFLVKMSYWERGLIIVGSLSTVFLPSYYPLIGLVLITVAGLSQLKRRRLHRFEPAVPGIPAL